MNQLQGKVAIVTGAAGGFGEGIAKLFVAEGDPETVRQHAKCIFYHSPSS